MKNRIVELMIDINVIPGEIFLLNTDKVCFITEDKGYQLYSLPYACYTEKNECGEGFDLNLPLLLDLLAGKYSKNDVKGLG